jgi:hypothetical protein
LLDGFFVLPHEDFVSPLEVSVWPLEVSVWPLEVSVWPLEAPVLPLEAPVLPLKSSTSSNKTPSRVEKVQVRPRRLPCGREKSRVIGAMLTGKSILLSAIPGFCFFRWEQQLSGRPTPPPSLLLRHD